MRNKVIYPFYAHIPFDLKARIGERVFSAARSDDATRTVLSVSIGKDEAAAWSVSLDCGGDLATVTGEVEVDTDTGYISLFETVRNAITVDEAIAALWEVAEIVVQQNLELLSADLIETGKPEQPISE